MSNLFMLKPEFKYICRATFRQFCALRIAAHCLMNDSFRDKMRLAVCVEFKTRRCGHLSIKACTPCLTGNQYLSLKLQCAIDEVDSVVFMVALWNRADHNKEK